MWISRRDIHPFEYTFQSPTDFARGGITSLIPLFVTTLFMYLDPAGYSQSYACFVISAAHVFVLFICFDCACNVARIANSGIIATYTCFSC